LHRRENEGKMMENEKNRDLNDKKAFEDYFTSFVSLVFVSLFYYLIL